MIEIQTLGISGFIGSILGMRNPFKNRDKSDSVFEGPDFTCCIIGPKDLELAQKLIRAGGDDDAKFMRMFHVQADIKAPLYWWKEMDTYKVATVANSESTMHTIQKKEFSLDDFAHEYLDKWQYQVTWGGQYYTDTSYDCLYDVIGMLNATRERYLHAIEVNDPDAKRIWYQMIQLLPSSYLQKRTWDANYQTLRRIYFARKDHKLQEWRDFCNWISGLPYGEELITYATK